MRLIRARHAGGPRVQRTASVDALTRQDTPARRRMNAAWLRAQIDGLEQAIVLESLRLSRIRTALRAIRAGEPWRGDTPASPARSE